MAMIFPRIFGPRSSLLLRPLDDVIRQAECLQKEVERCWRIASQTGMGQQDRQVKDDNEKFEMTFDMSKYKPDELAVSVDGRIVSVHGKQEMKNAEGYSQRSFTHQYTLQKDVDLTSIESSLSNEGLLSIAAAKKPSTVRKIPVTQTTDNDK